ncbi:Adenosyl cobinamide kinase/adenosyl cobinamide phosphate guanylyltransferase [uncultured Eubacteriales bacterium]|uniref:Adenosyl cobinamide kinase/adenosyl cobinamide phosphate guanylyltransferase n=1 Tax=uncultured Eubacteriales bacterium TaxID=172733 RepID=A0A212KJA8_9FIRM|nr:Adenosyl cobinamide kinase/adenosyl cobinamide phosphate guanylyltransferase [uncultured Eubacteriales bacterium]
MVLIIGGLAAGKREYVSLTYGYYPENMADGLLDGRPVLYNLQDLVRRDPGVAEDLLPVLLAKEIVICNEVGGGVVPLDRDERLWREACGRLCVKLAANAQRVIRVCCGIPQVLKG